MPKADKVKINVKERVDDDTIDLSLSDISEIPVNEIVRLLKKKKTRKNRRYFFSNINWKSN